MAKTKVRLDKWLWSVRMFKSRTLATKACERGKVKINKRSTKPSSDVVVGDMVTFEKNKINYTLKVLKIIDQRVGFPVAQTCYEDHTPQEEKDKFKEQYVIRHKGEFRDSGLGRPTKKDRRDIDDFKDWDIEFEDYFDE